LQTIDSIGGDLWIYDNNVLENIEGLDNIAPSSINNLNIYNNPLLADCEIVSICEYLLSPNGIVTIYNNATGCNNPEEVQEACLQIGIQDADMFHSAFASQQFVVHVYPNPGNGFVTIEYFLDKDVMVSLSILDYLGCQVDLLVNEKKLRGKYEVVSVASGLPEGVYYCRLQTGSKVKTGKIILIK